MIGKLSLLRPRSNLFMNQHIFFLNSIPENQKCTTEFHPNSKVSAKHVWHCWLAYQSSFSSINLVGVIWCKPCSQMISLKVLPGLWNFQAFLGLFLSSLHLQLLIYCLFKFCIWRAASLPLHRQATKSVCIQLSRGRGTGKQVCILENWGADNSCFNADWFYHGLWHYSKKQL